MTIRWADASAAATQESPPFLALQKRDAHVWTGLLDGTVAEFVDWLSGQTIDETCGIRHQPARLRDVAEPLGRLANDGARHRHAFAPSARGHSFFWT